MINIDILKKNLGRKKEFLFFSFISSFHSMYTKLCFPDPFDHNYVLPLKKNKNAFFMSRLHHLDATVIVLYCRLTLSDTEDTYTRPSTANVFDLPKQTVGP